MYTLKILLFPDFFQRLTFPWLEVKFPDYFLTCGNHVRSPDKAEKLPVIGAGQFHCTGMILKTATSNQQV